MQARAVRACCGAMRGQRDGVHCDHKITSGCKLRGVGVSGGCRFLVRGRGGLVGRIGNGGGVNVLLWVAYYGGCGLAR